jgi:hypothetical protein
MTIDTSLLTHLRQWNYIGTSSTYQYRNAYEYIKDSREGVISIERDFIEKLLSDLNQLNGENFPSVNDKNKNLRKITNLLKVDEFSLQICNDCESVAYEDELFCCYEDYLVCEDCKSDNYRYSDYRDTYISYEDYEMEQDEYNHSDEEEDYIYAWEYDVMQDLSLTALPNERIELNTAYYGVELEVEKRKDCPSDIAERVHNLMHKYLPFALLKSDGSLSNGFEIVSAPATLNAHKKYWKPFFDSGNEAINNLKSWNTDTTGLHIHISKSALSQNNIGKILVFINDEKNEDFINHIAGRNSNQWAKKSPKKISDGTRTDTDKYEAVNTSHRNSIELRIFRGNLSRVGFFRVLEFVDSLVGFVKNTTPKKLYYTDFIKWCELPQNRSSYPYFYGWLCRKSYCKGKPTRKIDWTNGLPIEKKNIA